MLDNLNFRNMTPELQDQTLKRLPLFSAPRPPQATDSKAEQGAAAEAVRLARFLSSF
jgi:hypothetical protein